jgi:predicted TIM-barrel fold metal-dependent hydrolase
VSLVDHNAMIGAYPFRALPEPTPARLVADMDRLGIAHAWVGHVPSIFYRDSAAGNDELFAALEPFRIRLLPVPAINPAWPAWERELARARAAGAPAVRTWPAHYGFAAAGPAMGDLAAACAEAGVTLVLAMRLEDARQRHRLDVAADLIGADVRATVRAHPRVQVLVTNADRAQIEETHWGSSPEEASRLRWDVSWVWGAPEDHLAHLVRTMGRERFVFGSQWPFRLVENAIVKLELLP